MATPEKIPDGPWGSATDGQKQGWRAKMNPRLRKALLGHQGAIQRLSRLLLKTALITGAACIIPPILGASTVLTLASSRAAPVPPLSELAISQLHAQAENALSVALYHLRQPAANVPGAARKAVQALSALNALRALEVAA